MRQNVSFYYRQSKTKRQLFKIQRRTNVYSLKTYAYSGMTWNSESQNALWTDEKKVNFDGPDGFHNFGMICQKSRS